MKKYLLTIALLFSFIGSSYCQNNHSDSLSFHSGRPSLPLQFLGGSIGYAVLFWPTGGYKFLITGNINDAGGAIFSWLPAGIAVNLVGNISSGRKISYWWGILGAFLGSIVLGPPLYHLAFDNHSPGVVIRYMVLSFPAIIGSMLVYHLGVNNDDAKTTVSTSEILIFPSFTESYGAVNLVVRF